MEALKRAMTIGAENLPYFDPRSMLLRAEGVNIIIHNNLYDRGQIVFIGQQPYF